jgi:hypothetical protein
VGPHLQTCSSIHKNHYFQVSLDEILRMQREKQEQRAEREQAKRKILSGRGRLVQTEKADLFIDDA